MSANRRNALLPTYAGIRQRAYRRLAAEFPERFEAIHREERDRCGITPIRKAGTIPHGTNSRYAKGCKCQECRDAHAAYRRDLRARNRAS